MIETHVRPVAGVVTTGALPTVVVALAVTGETVVSPVVAEMRVVPVGRVVAVRTPGLPVDGGRLVTLQTVAYIGMAEHSRRPVIGVVTGRALPGVVRGRRVLGVAVDAVFGTTVGERARLPFGRGVARRASIAGVVCGGRFGRVTRRAIGEASMVEPCVLPGCRVVAVGTLPGVVPGRCIVRQVTTGAVGESQVIEVHHIPVRGIGVTAYAGVGIRFRIHIRGGGHRLEGLNAH